jgi:inorganic triphosphatase YgiF
VPGSPRLCGPEEVELKLAVVGEDPAATLVAIAALERLGPARLGPSTRHVIHDRYWDTPDGRLGGRRLSLRLRDVDGRVLFGLKGGGSASGGLFRRRELERPADPAGWAEIRRILEETGVPVTRPPLDSSEPADWLRAGGLVVTQDRRTDRVARLVHDRDRALAELALDTTRYRFGERVVTFREVEIEERAGRDTARDLGAALLERFPGRLEFATLGKYARGLQLERELGGGGAGRRSADGQSASG